MRKYKCPIHKSNEGFYDENGKWICWKCYEENEYYNPKGKVVDSYSKDKYLLRVVDKQDHVEVEVWHIEKQEKVTYYSYRDLSSAMRKFRELFNRLKNKQLNNESEVACARLSRILNQVLSNTRTLENMPLEHCAVVKYKLRNVILTRCILYECELDNCELYDCCVIECNVHMNNRVREPFSGSYDAVDEWLAETILDMPWYGGLPDYVIEDVWGIIVE